MDPVTLSLLGAGIMGGGSLLGGIFGSNATQAANQANIAQSQWQATGGYLPGLVKNAEAAGINPLAVLPGGGGSANIQAVAPVGSNIGDAMKSFGQGLSRVQGITSPHEEKMQYLQERDLESRIANNEALHAGQVIENARRLHEPGTPPTPRGGPWPLDLADELDKRMADQLHARPGSSSLDVINDVVAGWGRSAHDYLFGQ